MDPTENTPAPAEVTNDTLSQIMDLRGDATNEPALAPAPTDTPTPTPTPSETPAPATVADEDTDAEARRTALLREIAMDPAQTQQYVQGQSYAPPQPQGQADYRNLSIREAFEKEFPGDEFDSDDIEHQQFIQRFNNRDVYDYIEQAKQQEAAYFQYQQAEYLHQVHNQNNQTTVELLDTYVPGISDIAKKGVEGGTWNTQEEALFGIAVNLESHCFNQYASALVQQNQGLDYQTAYNYVLHNPQARAYIAQQIGPVLKEKAKDLGFTRVAPSKAEKVTPGQKQVMEQESYVESSSAVPANTANNFDKALQSGSLDKQVQALRNM